MFSVAKFRPQHLGIRKSMYIVDLSHLLLITSTGYDVTLKSLQGPFVRLVGDVRRILMCRYSVFGRGVADNIVVLLDRSQNNVLNVGVGQVVMKSSMLILLSSRVNRGCQSIEGRGERGSCGW